MSESNNLSNNRINVACALSAGVVYNVRTVAMYSRINSLVFCVIKLELFLPMKQNIML